MYGVMRERARNRPMQIVGLAVSAAATVAAANLLMSGFGNFVGAFTPPDITTLTTITPEKNEPPPLQEIPETIVESPFMSTTPLPLPERNFTSEEQPEKAITVADGEVSRIGDPEAAVAPPKAVRIAPKLRSQEKPLYPGTEIRLHNEGNTSLGLCIDARGRVTSANLVTSSGHKSLDEAALKWVKGARFSPGTVNGVAQAVCGHSVVYEWRLENAR